jgi:hypothetical protein
MPEAAATHTTTGSRSQDASSARVRRDAATLEHANKRGSLAPGRVTRATNSRSTNECTAAPQIGHAEGAGLGQRGRNKLHVLERTQVG